MKQIIKFPTRGHNTLDLILTNLKAYYDCPIKRSPFGLSDHVTVEVRPLARSELSKTKFSVKSRDLRPTKHLAMRAYLEAVDVHALVDSKSSCEEKVNMLEKIVNTGMDTLLPMRSKTVVINEPPWVNQSLKKMIRGRQKALAQGDFVTLGTV